MTVSLEGLFVLGRMFYERDISIRGTMTVTILRPFGLFQEIEGTS
jgi:hypothetical protein